VRSGEVVGLIGRNGAGKTTLLKILSRITAPTLGRAEISGRVGSLLEVGTGFHPELTGRENIFLNGAILGMRRAEIIRKFDQIVDFAEIERFIDTPVKHYSSGMYVRLAFAVAAHLEPEILLVDEVLAVGDIRFQRKCFEKVGEYGAEGRTVIFVSHSMSAITRLCQRTLLIDEGRIVADGLSHEIVGVYMNSDLGTSAARQWTNLDTAPGDHVVRLRSVSVLSSAGVMQSAADIRKPVLLEMQYTVLEPGIVLTPLFRLTDSSSIDLFTTTDTDPEWRQEPRPVGDYVSRVEIPGNFLAEGHFSVLVAINTISPTSKRLVEKDAVSFQVFDSRDGDTARGDWGGEFPGVVRPLLEWTTEFSE
jgi:lipopolysaccharide transport system ATP-binding protein